MKPTSTYKMSPELKRRLALGKWKSTEQKNAWKRAMIQAELEAEKKAPLNKDSK